MMKECLAQRKKKKENEQKQASKTEKAKWINSTKTFKTSAEDNAFDILRFFSLQVLS